MNKENEKGSVTGDWLQATRPRTLILAIACVGMGVFLAAAVEESDLVIAALTVITAALLQVLSNLANDYGDTIHGADHSQRSGPSRAVQSGRISAQDMRRAIVIVAVSSAVSGLSLLWIALGVEGLAILFMFLLIGAVAIWAAISYTAGRIPYGYAGLGDVAVLVFFGWVAVLGSYFLQRLTLQVDLLLPATSCGLFAVGVLNINNVRDIESDRLAGKMSIPVRLGLRRARVYHWLILIGAVLADTIFVALDYRSLWQFLFLVSVPLLMQNGLAVTKRPPAELDPYLGQLSLATLLFVILFGIGQILA